MFNFYYSLISLSDINSIIETKFLYIMGCLSFLIATPIVIFNLIRWKKETDSVERQVGTTVALIIFIPIMVLIGLISVAGLFF